MKKLIFTIGLLFLGLHQATAQNPPLNIAVTHFNPPFVVQAGKQQTFGFDILLMNRLCQIIQRDCEYYPMRFNQLLPSLTNFDIDIQVAVGGLTITLERAKIVDFTPSYLKSQASFLATANNIPGAFSLSAFNNKTIGVVSGTVFENGISEMSLNNSSIIAFPTEEELIEQLSEEDVDFALLDSPSADYWNIKSSGVLKKFGSNIDYGQGYGIAVEKGNIELLNQLNQALSTYLKSEDFKKDYMTYFGSQSF